MSLNPEQMAAVTYLDGPLFVIAGAGSGKTRVITQKMAYLIQSCDILPKHITALTFTNKAGHEMKSRVQELIGKKYSRSEGRVQVSTFHVLGLNILRRHAQACTLNAQFSLFDTNDSLNLIKELGSKISPLSDDMLKNVQTQISQWKNNLVLPQKALSEANEEAEHLASRFYCAYTTALQSYNAVDFDDLITLPTQLLQTHPDIRDHWQNKIRYLLVDEYQDTNIAQYHLIQCLTGVRQALTMVGDDDQSIYAWRGANPDNIRQLQTDFPRLKIIKLEQNYRSTRTILEAANHLIAFNPHLFEKRLWSQLDVGDSIRILALDDEQREAERIVHEIIAKQFKEKTAYQEFAILYRSNYQARPLEQALREQGIPYQISGGTSLFDRIEIKDLFAYFRLMVNPKDDAAFLRCVNTPKREIGPQTLEKLGEYAKSRELPLFYACQEMGLTQIFSESIVFRLNTFAELIEQTKITLGEADDFSEALTQFVQELHYFDYLIDQSAHSGVAKKRIENVEELLAWIKRLANKDPDDPLSFEAVIQKLLLIDMLERQSQNDGLKAVQLMTLHAAKGLEFPHVFMIGLEEENLPHKNNMEDDLILEERRLCYVGITRAQVSLTLSYAKERRRYGETQSTEPSRFLEELPKHLLHWEGQPGSPDAEVKAREQGKSHLSSLKALLEDR